jgi:phospholipase C
MMGAAVGSTVLPSSIETALAIPPRRRTGTIQDVEHVVILMQENRSFDHYFGMLRGVRGFNDPRPAPLPNGKTVWHQPAATIKTEHYRNRGLSPAATHVLPFYLDPRRTTEFQAGTDHGWSSGHLAWNNGHYNQWINQKQDVLTMGYLKRNDLSFHYALADAFTLCDAYFCSVFADTCPNRIYLWTGTIDARNRLGRKRNGPGLEERHDVNGYTWTTYPERLQKAGISWKVYQGGTGVPDTPTDNYTDNSLEFFAQYHVQEGAAPESDLVRLGVSKYTLRDLRDDVVKGGLPQVSWIVAPYQYCEHPKASPTDGACYISLVLDALTADPEVWSRTALLINYDENDGLFDHVVPPMPPRNSAPGAHGMVSADLRESLVDEFVDRDKHTNNLHPLVPGADPGGLQPVGLGPRVPMLVISPWSAGGWVCSEVFDHTSVLRFLEKRFGVEEPNLSAWRRSICGDLTSAFDFSGAQQQHRTSFPVPRPMQSLHLRYAIPLQQKMPIPEPGTRSARPLPYSLQTKCRVEHDRVWIDLINRGTCGAAFYIYNALEAHKPPRRYAVSAGDSLQDFWHGRPGAPFDLAVYGPNGYVVHQSGKMNVTQPQVEVSYTPSPIALNIAIQNLHTSAVTLSVAEAYTNYMSGAIPVAAGDTANLAVPVAESSGWFDLCVSAHELSGYLRRFSGHVENGQASISDPGPSVYAVGLKELARADG